MSTLHWSMTLELKHFFTLKINWYRGLFLVETPMFYNSLIFLRVLLNVVVHSASPQVWSHAASVSPGTTRQIGSLTLEVTNLNGLLKCAQSPFSFASPLQTLSADLLPDGLDRSEWFTNPSIWRARFKVNRVFLKWNERVNDFFYTHWCINWRLNHWCPGQTLVIWFLPEFRTLM